MTKKLTILFSNNTHRIGDFLMMLRSVELTRLYYPGAKIFLRCRYPELIQCHPAIDDVLNINAQPQKPDIIIDGNSYCANYERKHQSKIAKSRHQLFCEYTSIMLQNNNIQWDGQPQSLWISRTSFKWARTIISNASNGKIPIGIFGESRDSWRSWPYMRKLISYLLANQHFAVFYFDTKNPAPFWGVHSFVGYSLDQLTALVSCMQIIVSNDSGGLHLAGSLSIPTIGIFGPSNPLVLASIYQGMSWPQPIKCPIHPCWYHPCVQLHCLKKIKPAKVYKMICQKAQIQYQVTPHLSDLPSIRRDKHSTNEDSISLSSTVRCVDTTLSTGNSIFTFKSLNILNKASIALYIMPQTFGDVFLSKSIIASLKKRYDKLDVMTRLPFAIMFEDDPNVNLILEYPSEQPIFLEKLSNFNQLSKIYKHIFAPYVKLQCQSGYLQILKQKKMQFALDYALQCGIKPTEIIPTGLSAKRVESLPKKYIITQVKSRVSSKEWSHFQTLFQMFKQQYPQIAIIHLGAKGETTYYNTIPFLGLDFYQVSYIVQYALLYVGVDSIIAHMSAVANIPTIEIFGGTDVDISKAWGDSVVPLAPRYPIKGEKTTCFVACHAVCVQATKCIDTITPIQVMEAIKKCLMKL